MPSIFDKIYNRSPVFVQNLGVNAFALIWRLRRYGGNFNAYVNQFSLRENNSQAAWDTYQVQALRKLLIHSLETVPYYRDSFSKNKIEKETLTQFTLDNLSQLPLLFKDTIRQQPENFLSWVVPRRNLHVYHTSGTTGTPLPVYFTNDIHRQIYAAYEVRVRHWAGVNHRMSRAMIGGRLVVPKAEANPPFWRYNAVERQLYMSAFHISPGNVPHYVSALNHYRPDYLVGYASSHYFLARMILEQGLEMHYTPKAVLTSSEKLTNEMRSTITKAYQCEVFDGYSGVENCCLISECEHHQLHISPDVGIVEILDDDGRPVPPGQAGQIVATGLLNGAQPLIRYCTGDLGVLSYEPCPCGRRMPIVKELVGRLEDTVVGQDGREMVRFHGIFVGIPNIREGQVIQESLTSFCLRLAVDPQFTQQDRDLIQQRFEDRLGKIDLSYEYVDRIPRTENGKFRAVISLVKRHSQSLS